MKKSYLLGLFFALSVFGLFSCKKDTDVNTDKFSINKEKEKVVAEATSATISGTYSYSGKINSIEVEYAENEALLSSSTTEALVEGKNYSVKLLDLHPGTQYYYRYVVDFGTDKNYQTETYTFSTLSEAPTVQTLELVVLDSTSVVVKCNVLSDGGSDVTERGVLWNTYGNPTIDDEHKVCSTSGLGEYQCHFQELAMGTKYYFRAYAKNAIDVGYGEVMEFGVDVPVGLPIVIILGVSDVTTNSAVCHIELTSDGGAALTELGVCWSKNHNPSTLDGHATVSDFELGEHTVSMTGLDANEIYYVRAYATNEKGTSYGSELSFGTQEGLPTVVTGDVTNVTSRTASCSGQVIDQGASEVTSRGVCWSTNPNPTLDDSHVSSGSGLGSFSVEMTGLSRATRYYVKAYATNGQGTAYGLAISFNTEGEPSVVTIDPVGEVTANSALCGGTVIDDGGLSVTDRGFCWSTQPMPTMDDNHASCGSGTGHFTYHLTGLIPGTTYYVRAYSVNSLGISYSNVVSFVTVVMVPTVTTLDVTEITMNSAVSGGNVTDDGGATVTERGVCWSTNPNPTTDDSHVACGSGTGSFVGNITGLMSTTTYYVRAYAVNSAGPGYGQNLSFTTEQFSWNNGTLPGLFSVSQTEKVYFSQGNLQYQASTNTWRFADTQYDYIGEANMNISSSYSGWIDLFGWGTSGFNHGAVCYQPWSTSQNYQDYYAYGQWNAHLFQNTGKADWGYNAISNGGNQQNYWRTLKLTEAIFLLDSRQTPSGIRFVKAKVNGLNGLIIPPDDWDVSTFALNNPNALSAPYNANTISLQDWSNILEPAGAVFFPNAGDRSGTYAADFNDYGFYWLANFGTQSFSYLIFISDSGNNIDDLIVGNYRYAGFSVRLVRDAN
jgi:hypothetical protein